MERGPGLKAEDSDLQKLISTLRHRKLTVGFAESCTGGLLSASLAALPGVSDIYMGAIVCYSYSAKTDLLGVSWETLNSLGAVSEEVARQMARGACERLKANCTIAITGIAGPSGGTVDKPVGTVWFGLKGPGFELCEKQLFSGDRLEIQKQSVEFALKLINSKL